MVLKWIPVHWNLSLLVPQDNCWIVLVGATFCVNHTSCFQAQLVEMWNCATGCRFEKFKMVEKIIMEVNLSKNPFKSYREMPFLDEETSRDSIIMCIWGISGNIYLHASLHVLLGTRHWPESASEWPLLCSFGEISSKVTWSQKSLCFSVILKILNIFCIDKFFKNGYFQRNIDLLGHTMKAFFLDFTLVLSSRDGQECKSTFLNLVYWWKHHLQVSVCASGFFGAECLY